MPCFDRHGGMIRYEEDWRDMPVIWQRGGSGAAPCCGDPEPPSRPPKPPTAPAAPKAYDFFYMLATVADLIRLGYRFINGVFIRKGKTRNSWEMTTVEMWYWSDGELRHVCGFGGTSRSAYRDADRKIRETNRLRRQHEDFEDEAATYEIYEERASL